MLMDEAEITIKGGHGGPGIISFGPKQGSGPDGGNGGRGGDFYVVATSDITLLNQFSQKIIFSSQNGQPGGKNRRSGKDGEDFELKLPVGTSILNTKTGEVVLELTQIGQKELLLKGGKGGRGNYEFRSSRRTTPMIAQSGLPGDELQVKVVLKLIADFGLIGLPNAGKSSLLNELTNANTKTASYPFTTLSPNLGIYKGKVIADIPGLIEGASVGRGLGIGFLKHIEKVGVLLHCISTESTDPKNDYKTVRKEMGNYNKTLLKKPEIILLTKSDLVDKKTLEKTKKLFSKTTQVIPVSIHDWESLEKLRNALH